MSTHEERVRAAIEADRNKHIEAAAVGLCCICGVELDIFADQKFYYQWVTSGGLVQKAHSFCTPPALQAPEGLRHL